MATMLRDMSKLNPSKLKSANYTSSASSSSRLSSSLAAAAAATTTATKDMVS